MKNVFALPLLLSFVLLSRAQTQPAPDPTVGNPAGMSVSIPSEMHGRGDIDIKITLHYREAGTHHLTNNDFRFYFVDDQGDQIKQGLIPSSMRTDLTLEGTDPVYTAHLGINTQNNPPLTTGARYQLVVILRGPPALVNVKSFKVSE